MLYFQTEHGDDITDERWYKTIIAHVYCSLGNKHFHVSDYKKALEYFKLHLSIAKDVKDKVEEASAYGNLGYVHCHLVDLKNAMKYHQQCLNLANDAGDKRIVLVRVHRSLWFGKSHGLLYQQCLSIAREASYRRKRNKGRSVKPNQLSCVSSHCSIWLSWNR